MVKRIVVVFNLSFRTNIFIITYQPGPTNEDEGGNGEDETTAGGALVVFLLLCLIKKELNDLILLRSNEIEKSKQHRHNTNRIKVKVEKPEKDFFEH